MQKLNYISYMGIIPDRIKCDDAIAVKVVAVAGGGREWAAYMGDTDQPDEDVAKAGDKINQDAAEALFPQFPNSEWRYRR